MNKIALKEEQKNIKNLSISHNLEKGKEVINNYAKILTSSPGVYRMINIDNNILYIGKAKNLKKRVKSYTNINSQSNRIKRMISQTNKMEFIITKSETEALLLEANLIKKYKPPFNILMRDDKSFLKILINKEHKAPRLMKHRGKNIYKGDYYGPFTSASSVNKSINAFQKAFLLRTCTDNVFNNRSRPCLLYQIKRCSAPCTEEIKPTEYKKLVDGLNLFLNGKTEEITNTIYQEMQELSKSLDYEGAAILRDRLEAISQIQSKQIINSKFLVNADIFGIYGKDGVFCIQVFFFRAGQNWGNKEYFPRADNDISPDLILDAFLAQFYTTHPCPEVILLPNNIINQNILCDALSIKEKKKINISVPKKGEKYKIVKHASLNAKESLDRKLLESKTQKKLLAEMKDIFNLRKIPKRIEIYDNSHIQGQYAVGCMVVAGEDGFQKSNYRKFNIKSQDMKPGDDYAMMKEVLERRLGKISSNNGSEQYPDLIIIDGGLGQLNITYNVLDELGISDIDVIAIAKNFIRNTGPEHFYMKNKKAFRLKKNDPVLFFLQRLRDEAHRFAIGSNRIRRRIAISSSSLDSIQNIGPKRKKELLKYFGTIKSLEKASHEDLLQVTGISQRMAKEIYSYFHEDRL